MIDWLTLRLSPDRISPEVRAAIEADHAWVLEIEPSGEVVRRMPRRERRRSDSHEVGVLCAYDLEVSGSPARLSGDRNNVFGERRPVDAARLMLRAVERRYGVTLPGCSAWRATRVDITQNFVFANEGEVRQALAYLRGTGGGHYQVRSKGETVYWNASSKWRAGKAYGKGAHLDYLSRTGREEIDPELVALARRLLRLELTLRGEWIRERAASPWWSWTVAEVEGWHMDYFGRFLAGEVAELPRDVEAACVRSALTLYAGKSTGTVGQGRAAYRTYLMVRQVGLEQARELSSRATFSRHLAILRHAGLALPTLRDCHVVPLTRKALCLSAPVHGWDDLRRAA